MPMSEKRDLKEELYETVRQIRKLRAEKKALTRNLNDEIKDLEDREKQLLYAIEDEMQMRLPDGAVLPDGGRVLAAVVNDAKLLEKLRPKKGSGVSSVSLSAGGKTVTLNAK